MGLLSFLFPRDDQPTAADWHRHHRRCDAMDAVEIHSDMDSAPDLLPGCMSRCVEIAESTLDLSDAEFVQLVRDEIRRSERPARRDDFRRRYYPGN